MKILIKGLNDSISERTNTLKVLDLQKRSTDTELLSGLELKKLILKDFPLHMQKLNEKSFKLYSNGKFLSDEKHQKLTSNQVIEIKFIILGGKGGFGSLLKGQPPVKKRTNNFDSCRDLSGRRLRHVNQEKQLRDYQQRKLDEERMLKEYTNNSESNMNNYVEKLHQKEIETMNINFHFDNNEVSDSISSSIKYLMRKRTRAQKNLTKIEKLDIKDYNNKKISEHNKFNFEKFKNEELQSIKVFKAVNNHMKDLKKKEERTKSLLQEKEICEENKGICNNFSLNLKGENQNINNFEAIPNNLNRKQNKFDNLSQISDDSIENYNKEDLEKELMNL